MALSKSMLMLMVVVVSLAISNAKPHPDHDHDHKQKKVAAPVPAATEDLTEDDHPMEKRSIHQPSKPVKSHKEAEELAPEADSDLTRKKRSSTSHHQKASPALSETEFGDDQKEVVKRAAVEGADDEEAELEKPMEQPKTSLHGKLHHH